MDEEVDIFGESGMEKDMISSTKLDQLIEEVGRLTARIERLEWIPPHDSASRYSAVVAAGLDNGGAPMGPHAINAAYDCIPREEKQ